MTRMPVWCISFSCEGIVLNALSYTDSPYAKDHRSTQRDRRLFFPDRLEIIPVTPSLRSRGGSELSEESGSTNGEILRFAQDDNQDTTQVMSPLALRCAQGCGSLRVNS